ncbi:hypothetical protein [Mucilaginibacter sp.]
MPLIFNPIVLYHGTSGIGGTLFTQKTSKTAVKDGFCIVFDSFFHLQKPDLGSKMVKKRRFWLYFSLIFNEKLVFLWFLTWIIALTRVVYA